MSLRSATRLTGRASPVALRPGLATGVLVRGAHRRVARQERRDGGVSPANVTVRHRCVYARATLGPLGRGDGTDAISPVRTRPVRTACRFVAAGEMRCSYAPAPSDRPDDRCDVALRRRMVARIGANPRGGGDALNLAVPETGCGPIDQEIDGLASCSPGRGPIGARSRSPESDRCQVWNTAADKLPTPPGVIVRRAFSTPLT